MTKPPPGGGGFAWGIARSVGGIGYRLRPKIASISLRSEDVTAIAR
jgi:hypothetical protein